MTDQKDEDRTHAEDERRSERREFLILLSGGAALAGVGILAGCDSGNPTGPSESSQPSSSASSESSSSASSESSTSSESSSSSSSSESSESSSSS